MHIYLVLPWNGIRTAKELIERFDARPNMLLSYARAGNEFGLYLRTYRRQLGKIMLDSGAFSEMAGTQKIDLESYINYLVPCHDLFDYCVNLDVEPEKYDVRMWNLAKLKRAGLDVLPVVHDPYAGEIDELYDMGHHYLLLGSSWGSDRKQLDFIFGRNVQSGKYPGIKFHKLGTATYKGLCEYPYYSSDSAGFVLQGGYGDVLFWNEHREPNPNGDCTDWIYFGGRKESPSSRSEKYADYPYLGQLEDYLWRTFEYGLSDLEGSLGAVKRWIVNGKYTLDLEKRMTEKYDSMIMIN